MGLRGKIQDLYYEISADIDHGECFYNERMFNSYLKTIEKLKELSTQYYQESQMERDEDE